ncbi:MAG: hypothetical protein ACRD2F_03575, partial [Terriglobales bacterium]
MNGATLLRLAPPGQAPYSVLVRATGASRQGRPVYHVTNFASGKSFATDDLAFSFKSALPWIAGAVGALLIPGVGAALGGVLGGVGTAIGAVTGTLGTALGGIGSTVGTLATSIGSLGTAATAIRSVTGGGAPAAAPANQAQAYAQEAAMLNSAQAGITTGTATDAQLTAIVQAAPGTVPANDPNAGAWMNLQNSARQLQGQRALTAA